MPEVQNLENDFAPNLALPWVVRMRYAMVFGGAVTLWGVGYFLGFRPDFLWTIAPLALVLGTNVWLHRVASGSVRAPQRIIGVIFLVDTVCLTLVLGLTGGPMNPFSLLYLVQITLAAVVLQKQWIWAPGTLATLCFGALSC